MRSGAEGEHRTGEDDGRSRTLDSTGSTQPIARGRSRAPPAVPAPQPVRQVRTRDATEGVAQAERGARSFRTDVQTFPSFGFLTEQASPVPYCGEPRLDLWFFKEAFQRSESVQTNQTVSCPHCMNNVPWGASVCRGCHAEISYGTPRASIVVFIIVSVTAGWYAAKLVHDHLSTNSTVLWVVFGIVFALVGVLSIKICKRLYTGRTWFRRIYRTK